MGLGQPPRTWSQSAAPGWCPALGRQKPRGFPAAGHYVMCLPCLAALRQVDGRGPGPASTCPVCCLVGLPRATGLSGNVGIYLYPQPALRHSPAQDHLGRIWLCFLQGHNSGTCVQDFPVAPSRCTPSLPRLGGPTGEMGSAAMCAPTLPAGNFVLFGSGWSLPLDCSRAGY